MSGTDPVKNKTSQTITNSFEILVKSSKVKLYLSETDDIKDFVNKKNI